MVEPGSEGAGGLVHQQDFGLDSQSRACTGTAAGRRRGPARSFQAVFHLVPESGAPQGAFHQLIQLRLIADAVEPGAVEIILS